MRAALCGGALSAILLASAAPAQAAAPQGAAGQRNLLHAGLAQAGRSLILTLDTAGPVPLAELERRPSPRRPRARYICLSILRAGGSQERWLCLGGKRDVHRRIGLETLDATGHVTATTTLAARVKRPRPTRLTVALVPGKAGLTPRHYRWRVLEGHGECGEASPAECEESLPAEGLRSFRLRPVRPVGCTGGTAGVVYNGPRNGRVVALTFDDGPSSFTPGVLSVLRREHVPGTFFEIGEQIAQRAQTVRRIVREGNEIANHTMHHGFYPGYADLAATDAVIRATTHFEPCLFRPPGGAFDSSTVAAAGRAGLKTILWDVDPTDWSTPGTGAIYSRVVGAAQPGSIILMHDGGGDRSETLAALPAIIDTLRTRGYRFATVSELLGQRIVYSPYG